MAITDLTRIETSIRLASKNSLGCGFLYLAGGATILAGQYPDAHFCAIRQIDPGTDTTLTNIISLDATGFPGGGLVLPKASISQYTYMNFSGITTDKDILLYYRCR